MLWLRFLHLLFAIAFVAGQVMGNFASRGLRTRNDPASRQTLVELLGRAFWSTQLPGLIGAAALGNLLAVRLGLRMATSSWLQQVNALFVLMLIALVVGTLPALRRLRGAAGADFDHARRRWTLWHSLVDLLYLITLVRMVWR